MAIVIFRMGQRYRANVTPPHCRGEAWSTPEPMTADELVDALRERGCHQTDIGDAFFDADPEWLIR